MAWRFDDGITPIEIRPGVFVRIVNIPHDLTKAEAEKIAAIILAYAAINKEPRQ